MRFCVLKTIGFYLFSCFIDTGVFAQISIEFPTERIVIQRNNSNQATLSISGNYTQTIDRVEAKITAINNGSSTDWVTIQSNVSGGVYSGNIQANGGWYRLEVRGRLGDQVVGNSAIDRVGVGEVFLIAGQSNGQGFHNFGAPDAQDDRVSCVDYNNNGDFHAQELPYPTFSHLNSGSNIAPRGQSAWSWGRLGDLLASRLGVPILFYNVAFEGTRVKTWRESIGGTAMSPYINEPYTPSGIPFLNLRWVMQYYVPITGIRAVLWQQGEAESIFGTPSDEYVNDLKNVIQANRNESQKNVSWVIALSSYDNRSGSNSNTISAQQRVINEVSNTFKGPSTDQIQVPRIDPAGVHFFGDGLVQLAEAWNNQLNDQFFGQSQPQSGATPLNVRVSCNGNNSLNLDIDMNGYSNARWNNGASDGHIVVGNGNFRARVRDNNGNYIFSPEIRINQSIQPEKPSISLEGSNPVCIGNTATLISNTSNNIRWNTGATNSRIDITSGGDFYVTAKSVYGCENTSDSYRVNVLNSPLPETPKITIKGATTFCEGGEVGLESNSPLAAFWTNGASTASILARTSGDYNVRARDEAGCFSQWSETVHVKVNPLPAKPQIAYSGPPVVCEGDNVALNSNYESGNTWNTGALTSVIKITKSGSYFVTQKDNNGCVSVSDEVKVNINPLPTTPTVAFSRPTTFCDGDYTILKASEANTYIWNNGSNNGEISVRESGDYFVYSKDANGCVSKPSASIKVTKNPLPPKPSIAANGNTTFCENLSVQLQSTEADGYLWSNGSTTRAIGISSSGVFTVKTKNKFDCYSETSNSIITNTISIPSPPLVKAISPTLFCDGDQAILVAANSPNYHWNNDLEGDRIIVEKSGAYAARTLDSKGCYSNYSDSVMVTVKPKPDIPTIKQIGPFTLLADGSIHGGKYVWDRDASVLNEINDRIKATKSGTYTVIQSISYDSGLVCHSPKSLPYKFNIENNSDGMVVYPNPSFTGTLTVEILPTIPHARIDLIGSNGVILITKQNFLLNKQIFIDVSDLPTGVYIVRISSPIYTNSKKIVINN